MEVNLDKVDLNKYPRQLEEMEFEYYLKSFPRLQKANVTALGPNNPKFNCISWSLGFEDRWIDVGETKDGLSTLYAHYFYVGCDTASAAIDVYAVGAVPKHAAKIENATTCSSKIQMDKLLRHLRQELEGNEQKIGYGEIYGHFMKHESHPGNDHPSIPGPDHPNNHELPTPLPVGQPGGKPPVTPVHPQPPTSLHPAPTGTHASPAPTHASTNPTAPSTHAPAHPAPQSTHGPSTTHPQGHRQQIKLATSTMEPFDPIPPTAENVLATTNLMASRLQQAFPPAVANFDSLFEAWKATWYTPEMKMEASSTARAKGPEFDALVKLGPAIIPLVVKKLADPDNFFAIQLYNALEKDEGVKVDPENILDHNVLQRHANLIVDMNHQRHEEFASKLSQWKEYQDNLLSGNSKDYLDHDAYRSMVQMGPGVIGQVLHHYADEPAGWWHEMLHEIVHGRPSGARTFYKDRLYADWKKWFENGQPHEEAPKSA